MQELSVRTRRPTGSLRKRFKPNPPSFPLFPSVQKPSFPSVGIPGLRLPACSLDGKGDAVYSTSCRNCLCARVVQPAHSEKDSNPIPLRFLCFLLFKNLRFLLLGSQA